VTLYTKALVISQNEREIKNIVIIEPMFTNSSFKFTCYNRISFVYFPVILGYFYSKYVLNYFVIHPEEIRYEHSKKFRPTFCTFSLGTDSMIPPKETQRVIASKCLLACIWFKEMRNFIKWNFPSHEMEFFFFTFFFKLMRLFVSVLDVPDGKVYSLEAAVLANYLTTA
jgi:hypothetical protein